MFWPLLATVLGGAAGYALSNKKARGGISDFLLGSDKFKKTDAFSSQQMALHNNTGQLLQNSGGYNQAFGNLQSLLDPSNSAYDRFTQPHMDQFNNQTLPMLAERFAGAGANSGALSSSAFGQSLGAAGAGLQNNLASLKAGLQQKAGSDIFAQYENFLGQKPYYHYQQQNPGVLGPAINTGIKAYLGGM